MEEASGVLSQAYLLLQEMPWRPPSDRVGEPVHGQMSRFQTSFVTLSPYGCGESTFRNPCGCAFSARSVKHLQVCDMDLDQSVYFSGGQSLFFNGLSIGVEWDLETADAIPK